MKKPEIDVKLLKAEVKKLDPHLSEDENSFKTALLLLSIALVGTSVTTLSRLTKLPKKFIQPRIENLEKSSVIKDGKIFANWFDKEEGGIAFWCDVMVAEGMLKRGKA